MDALVQERLAQLQREAEEEVAAQERDEQAVLARRRGVERARWELDRAAEERDATRSYVASGRHDELASLRARDERRSQREVMEAAEAAKAAEAEAAAVEAAAAAAAAELSRMQLARSREQLQQHVRSQAAERAQQEALVRGGWEDWSAEAVQPSAAGAAWASCGAGAVELPQCRQLWPDAASTASASASTFNPASASASASAPASAPADAPASAGECSNHSSTADHCS